MSIRAFSNHEQVPLKRKAENPIEPSPKKRALNPIKEIDFSPLFYTILGHLTSEHGEKPLSPSSIAQILSQDPDSLLSFRQFPLAKIKEQFVQHLKGSETIHLKSQVYQVLGNLYEGSLINSPTKMLLVKTAEDLPKLKKKLEGDVKQEILRILNRAQSILKEGQNCHTLQEIKVLLPNLDKVLRELNDFRVLKQYKDSDDNQRMIDLALTYRKEKAVQQYPKIISDYPALIKQIGQLTPQLKSVSNLVKQLTTLRIDLQKNQAALLGKPEKIHPLQSRFIDAFSTPFYRAFGEHFWNFTWNSLRDPEVAALVQKIPNWKEADPNAIDYTLSNSVWGKYLPNDDFSDWILKTIELLSTSQLDMLESKLQELDKSINQLKENSSLDKETKNLIQTSILDEMQTLCSAATKPSFSTLKELKTFLAK